MWNQIILDVACIVCNKSLHKIKHNHGGVASRKMGKITNRRSRTPNWSIEEKQYLLELIKERKAVVVPKNNNGPNHYEEKDIAWNQILGALALKFGSKFNDISTKKVKTQWQNMKRIAREEIALHGTKLEKYTRQSTEVCHILDMIKDGVIHLESTDVGKSSTDTSMTANVEIKAERIDDEDFAEPDDNDMETSIADAQNNSQNDTIHPNSSASFVSEQASEECDPENVDQQASPGSDDVPLVEISSQNARSKESLIQRPEMPAFNPYHKNHQEFFRFSTLERELKMETLKEERRVVRAMREAAELNKIIAEERLKHVLWVKKRDTT